MHHQTTLKPSDLYWYRLVQPIQQKVWIYCTHVAFLFSKKQCNFIQITVYLLKVRGGGEFTERLSCI